MKSQYTGIKRIVAATGNSINGLRATFIHERAFRQDLLLCALAAILLAFLGIPMPVRVLMWFSLLFILLAELVNTAIENVIDRISEDYHDLSKRAKDVGSAIVMLTLAGVAAFWIGMIIIFA